MEKIQIIFTRDFDQWIQEMIRNSLVVGVKTIWGISFSDQIVHFNGKTFTWYRYDDDMLRVKNFLISHPLDEYIFSEQSQKIFLERVAELRTMSSVPPRSILNNSEYLQKITDLFVKMYPYYPLGIFIPGHWRQEFLQLHGKDGEKILKRLYNSRTRSEGLLKEVGNFLRAWLSPALEQHSYLTEYVRLLTVGEIKNLVENNLLPERNVLEERGKGYVYFDNEIFPITNFEEFLEQHNLFLPNNLSSDESGFCKGTVAYPFSGLLEGKVQLMYNSYDVNGFKPGSILVTPMTSPEYLPAMKKAKAIITDEGGLTCHAAIVSRELGVPCIIGTKIATQVLKDGDMVEVDAEKGIVRKI